MLLALMLFTAGSSVWAGDKSITGFWKTFDDKTGEPKGLVEITEADGKFRGVLRETYSKTAKVTCEVCPGDKKGQPYKGLEIVWDVKATGKDEWGEGHIMDPNDGKTYRVKFALAEGGDELKVRGYLGISLFGRSQKWTRGAKP